MQPTNNHRGAHPNPPLNAPPTAMGNYTSGFIIVGMVQGEAMVCFSYFSTVFLLLLLYFNGQYLWFLSFFSIFLALFLSRLWEGQDQGDGRTAQYGDHRQNLTDGKEGQNIGGDMGVFSGGYDKPIGQSSYF